jgi:alanine or glycine:cation symporter, AGCS family
MDLNNVIVILKDYLWGWPMLFTIIGVGLLVTVATYFVQVRYFLTSWRLLLFPGKSVSAREKGAALTPFQAFLGALGTSVGNGNIAGIATAVAYGGPGAGFWVLVSGFIGMALRFAEVYLGTYFDKHEKRGVRGGPIAYLSHIPGRTFMPYVFALLFFFYGLSSGNAMQANAIGEAILSTWGVSKFISAVGITLFLMYAIMGGAKRIIQISDKLTPFKVLAFLVSAVIVLVYHYQMIIPTLKLIFTSAFSYQAATGGAIGFTLQEIIKNGFARGFNSTEAGFGVAASFFGASGSRRPVNDSIISMVGVFISTFFVCFLVAMVVVASGVWNNGAIGSALAVDAYNTVFGAYGGWVVTFVAASFGLGVMVAFLFIGKTGYFFLTNGRGEKWFYLIFCAIAFIGTQTKVDMIWNVNDLVNGVLLLVNLYAIVMYTPILHKAIKNYRKS